MKILIMKFRNIGDTLLATPLANNLKAHYPQAQIHFACNEGCEAMCEGNPNIDKIHIYKRKSIKNSNFFGKIKAELGFLKELKKEHFDIAINATSGDRGVYLALLSGAKTRISYTEGGVISRFITHAIEAQDTKHTIEADLGALKALNLEVKDPAVKIYFNDFSEFFSAENALPENFIHIHPMSRWLFKAPKDELVAKIIDFCAAEFGLPCVMSCANDEREIARCQNIISLCKYKPQAFLGSLSLKQVAFLSSKARLFIGADTAIMHMAAAVDTPVIALFGPSSAQNWGPWDNALKSSQYKATSGIQNMGKHTVIQANYSCVPCHKDGCDGSKISRCLNELDFELIKNVIKTKI